MNGWKHLAAGTRLLATTLLCLASYGCAASSDDGAANAGAGVADSASETAGSSGDTVVPNDEPTADPTPAPDGMGGAGVTDEPGTGGGPTTLPNTSSDIEAMAYFNLDDKARNQVSAGDVCDRLATLQCAGQALCCTQPRQDFATCKAQALASCRDASYLDHISADARAGFDAAAAQARFDAYEEKAINCDPSVTAWGESSAGLRGIMRGTVAPFGSCAPQDLSVAGAASALAYCLSPDENACLPDALFVTWKCETRGAATASCITDLNCAQGFYCPQADYLNPVHSKCATRLGEGSSCASHNECESFACSGGQCVSPSVEAAFCFE